MAFRHSLRDSRLSAEPEGKFDLGEISRLHLCENRDPIANLTNLHGGPVCKDTYFNPHLHPLIFVVPVGLNGMDINGELPRRGLYAYNLRRY